MKFISIHFNSFQFIFLLLIVALFSSCEPNLSNQIPSDEEVQRLEIAKIKSKSDMQMTFFKLSFKEQKSIWSNKIAQIHSKNVSKRHNELLTKLNEELTKAKSINNLYNENLESIVLELATITPQSDFIEMFMSLDNYNGSFNPKDFKYCEECIMEIKNDFKEKKDILIRNTQTQDPPKLENCNCNWTCGDGPGEVTSDCKSTSYGCGFLLLFSCKKYQ